MTTRSSPNSGGCGRRSTCSFPTRACDRVVEQVLDAPGLTNRQVVAYTLAARYHKRIAAHLGNIASSLVMPLHKLDYFDEEYLPGQTPPEPE